MRYWMIIGIVGMVGLFACSTRKSFDSNSDPEKKPELPSIQNTSLDSEEKPVTEVFEATYLLRIRTENGAELCEGTATLVGYSNFYTKLKGNAKCTLGLKIDLEKMMVGTDEFVPATKEEAKKLPQFGKISRVKKFRGLEYNPPRPFLLGPVVQNSSDFAGFTYEEDFEAIEPVPGQESKSFKGRIRYKVLGAGIKFRPEGYTQEFEDVLHWKFDTLGFDGLNRGQSMLYDSMEFYWNTKPIAIPMMRIQGSVKNFVDSGVLGSIGNFFIKSLTIDLILRQHTQL